MFLRTMMVLAASAAMLGAPAYAAPDPVWSEAPSVADMAKAYPAKAKAAGVGGVVNLTCSISRDGRAVDCAALGEQPSGLGFGFAARQLASRLKVGNAGMAGQEVRIPFTFDAALAKGETPTVTRPTWAELPAPEDFQASFPKTANGVNEVRVAMVCSVAEGGTLNGCTVDREEPAGQGYGQGALALAPKFRVGPWSQDGMPTIGAKVRVPIRYQLTQVAPPKS